MQSFSILVSFCNLRTPTTSPIGLVHLTLEPELRWSCTPIYAGFQGLLESATGLAVHRGKILALLMSEKRYFIAALRDTDLSPLYCQLLPEIQDGHSILVMNDQLYVVSTGTDEIFRYDLLDEGVSNPQLAWKASETRTDTHHVNAIAERDGELFVSAFGAKTGGLWASASNGYIHNISRNEQVRQGIYHPHSLTVKNGEIYYCDSHTNTVRTLEHDQTLFSLNGYTRGLAWLSDELVCMACSIGRRVSKSTGAINNPADPGEPAGECMLVVGSLPSLQEVGRIDLSFFGPEIYDVLCLSNEPADLLGLAGVSQRAERRAIRSLVDQLSQTNDRLESTEQELQLVYAGRPWRWGRLLDKVGGRLMPEGSGRASLAHSAFEFLAWPLHTVSKQVQRRQNLALLRRSPLFDAAWYLEHYRDVAQARLDPALHYLRAGGFEGRDPGPQFSSSCYLAEHPEVQAEGVNPLVHYLRYGRQLGWQIHAAVETPAP